MSMKLNGLTAAVHTPMHDNYSVNYDCVPAQAEHLAKGGASGAFVTGTTGECHSLTTEERLRMFDAWGRSAHRTICLMHRHWFVLRVTLARMPFRRWHQIFSSRLMPSHFAIGLLK